MIPTSAHGLHHVRALSLASLVSGAAICGAACVSPEHRSTDPLEDAVGHATAALTLPNLSGARDLGPVQLGAPAGAPFEVSGSDVVLANFAGAAATRVIVSVRPEAFSDASADIWLIDATNAVVASVAHGSVLVANLIADGTYRVVVREAGGRHARLSLAITSFAPVTAPGTGPKVVWRHPRTGGEALHAVLVRADDDVWAAGEGGAIVHWDGATLQRAPTAGTSTLTSIWAAGPSDVWAAGGGDLFHFEGGAWSRVSSGGAIVEVAGTGPTDVWTLLGTRAPQRIARWDGERWTDRDPPATFTANTLVVRGANEAWLFGGRAARFNGLAWSEVPVSTLDGTSLNAVTTLADGRLLVAGGTYIQSGLQLWNGSSWTSESAEGLYGGAATSVWGTSTEDLWAILNRRLYTRRQTSWQGRRFDRDDTMPADAFAVHGAVAGHPWVAAANGQLLRLEGSVWVPAGDPALPGCDAPVSGDAAASWIACARELVHHEGGAGTWVRHPLASVAGLAPGEQVRTAWAESATRLWATTTNGAVIEVDLSIPAVATPVRVVAHVANVTSIWGASASDVWLVGTGGALLHGGAAGFTEAPGDPPANHRFVIGTGAGDVLAIGANGSVTRWDSATWTSLSAGQGLQIARVARGGPGCSVTAISTGGSTSSVVCWTGGAWHPVASADTNVLGDLRDAVVAADGSTFATTTRGGFVHFEGATWTRRVDVPAGRMIASGAGHWTIGAANGVLEF